MKNWLLSNGLTILIVIVTVTFGYANFTTNVQALEKRVDRYEEKLDKALLLLERIDERTSK